MRRFYVPPTQIRAPLIALTGSEAHHILHVLRLDVGTEIEIFDGAGRSYRARIIRCMQEEVCCQILEEYQPPPKRDTVFVLGQGIPRGEKMAWIVEKSTELGVDAIIPLQTLRTIPRGDAGRIARWQDRWQRIAREAAKQCRRVHVPVIYPCTQWEQFLCSTRKELTPERPVPQNTAPLSNGFPGEARGELKLICWEGKAPVLRAVLPPQLPEQGVIFAVGPEGGFTEHEVCQAKEHGFLPVSLGRRLLRTETVSLAVLALLQHLYGDLG